MNYRVSPALRRRGHIQQVPATLLVLIVAIFVSDPAQSAKRSTTIVGTEHAQIAVGDGEFCADYALKNGFSFEILTAKYSVNAFNCYAQIIPDQDEKLIIMNLEFKNSSAAANYLGDGGALITAIDSNGQKYDSVSGSLALESTGDDTFAPTLDPGQGLGQPSLNDPLRLAIDIPARARIVKLVLNVGKSAAEDDSISYYIAGTAKSEAGEDGDPKNTVVPLPDSVRDRGDSSGALALDIGHGGRAGGGVNCPTNQVSAELDSIAYATTEILFDGNPPDPGKLYVIASVTVTNVMASQGNFFDAANLDTIGLTNAIGGTYPTIGLRKADKDEAPDDDKVLGPSEKYTFRIFFSVPRGDKLTSLIYEAGSGRKWSWDVSGVQSPAKL